MRKPNAAALVVWFVALATLTLAVSSELALAQSANCSQLSRSLRTLERNSDYRNLDRNRSQARDLASQISKAESSFVRGGCQKQLNDGQRLSSQCRTLARQITSARKTYTKLARSVETGQAIAQQRETVLQNIARFGCNSSGSSSARTTQTQRDNSRGSFLEQLFNALTGGQERIFEADPFEGYYGRTTYRTVCVRACDGYYWPVSFSTVSDYLGNDADQCQSLCPGADVELYYYRNPGESPEDMVSLNGQSYSNLPNAFRYRQEFDEACVCRRQIDYGTIKFAESGNQSRAVIAFAEFSIPLPVRDPREPTVIATVAEAVHIPLPRPRPDKEGLNVNVPAITTAVYSGDLTIIQSGEKSVRIVGPSTPYVQAAATGS